MDQRPFRFKRFSCFHHKSALKIGVDGVLLGCWADASNANNAIDIGTGCGVIALILAQRFQNLRIYAIDVHEPSIEEAKINIINSPWSYRVSAYKLDFRKVDGKFDFIISNPPYFDSGVCNPCSDRLAARHQGELSPCKLIEYGVNHLNPSGKIAMIFPADRLDEVLDEAEKDGILPIRKCFVRGHGDAPVKRVLLELQKFDSNCSIPACEEQNLTLELSRGVPTDEYRGLCSDFYLKF